MKITENLQREIPGKSVTAHDGPFFDDKSIAPLPTRGHCAAKLREGHADGGGGEEAGAVCNESQEVDSVLLQATEGINHKRREAAIAFARPGVILGGFCAGSIVQCGEGVGDRALEVGGVQWVGPGDVEVHRLTREVHLDVRNFVRTVLFEFFFIIIFLYIRGIDKFNN